MVMFFFRWVEDKPVAERLVDLWPNVAKIVHYWESLPKSKRPSSRSYSNVLSAVTDNLTPAKLHFFSYVAGIFQQFLTKYQSDKPMIPFLYSDHLKLVKSILCLVLKPDVVNPCSSLTTLTKIDLTDKSYFCKAKDIKVGFGAKCVDDLKNSDLVTNQGLKAYLNECITFVTTIASKLFDRSPLGSVIVRNADAFDPTAIASLEIDVLEGEVNRILMYLLKLRLVSATYSDKALADCSSFFEQVKKMHVDQLKLFDSSKTDLDYIYFHKLGKETKKHDKFAYILKIILTLSPGQAAVERSFSLGKSSLQTNITEESIIAKKVVRDHLLANKIELSSYEVPNKLILQCNSAHSKYKASLKEEAEDAERNAEAEKRKLIQSEIDELVDKEKKLTSACQSLDNDFVQLVGEAEKQPEQMIALVTKANALKRKQVELKEEFKELQKEIEIKRSKLS